MSCSAKVIEPPRAPLGRLLWLIVLIGWRWWLRR
jgi:hypothetical protein